jgi:hypothetical protein
MTTLIHTGRCLCGTLRYRVSGPVRNLCYCHCESCRRSAGAPVVAWGTVDRAGFEVTHGVLAIHRSSPDVERGICRACGTSLTYRHDRRTGEIDFTLASLDEPAGLAPQCHLWMQDKLPWVDIRDGLPRYATVPPASLDR